jgi:uncharacterized protein YndB with AHSA1/START domain
MTTPTITEATIEADDTVPAIHITRDFTATPAQLMRAHTDPELFLRWVGPAGMDSRIIAWDARDGGEWRYVSARAGEELGFRGCFHTIGERHIVQTFTYQGMPDDVALQTLRFEVVSGATTRLHGTSLCGSFESRDGWLASGMEVGVHDGYAKLDALIGRGDV